MRTRLFALVYDGMMAGTERAGFRAIRAGLLGDAAGDVLEIGAGTGLNLRHYGAGVRSLTLTEPDPSMFRRLEHGVARAGRAATVLRAPAEDLPFDDDAFDTVVSTLVLCGVDDQPRVAREVKRVLRPGGRFLFAEHVRSGSPRTARLQDRWNWLNRLTAGCECNRPTQQTLERTGFAMDTITLGELPKAPPFARPLVVGTARRAAGVPDREPAHTDEGTTRNEEAPAR
jgi:SAM-dependent methyltransferase